MQYPSIISLSAMGFNLHLRETRTNKIVLKFYFIISVQQTLTSCLDSYLQTPPKCFFPPAVRLSSTPSNQCCCLVSGLAVFLLP